MEILNVIEGMEIETLSLFGIVVVIILAIGVIVALGGYITEKGGVFLIGLGVSVLMILGLIIATFTTKGTGEYKPNLYEVVITDPDHVIDATKYRFIEERGSIVILEEVRQTKE